MNRAKINFKPYGSVLNWHMLEDNKEDAVLIVRENMTTDRLAILLPKIRRKTDILWMRWMTQIRNFAATQIFEQKIK